VTMPALEVEVRLVGEFKDYEDFEKQVSDLIPNCRLHQNSKLQYI
jgi:hypothetical protein